MQNNMLNNNMDSQNYLTQPNNLGFVQQPVTVGQGMTSMPVAAPLLQSQPFLAAPQIQYVPQFIPQHTINVYENVPRSEEIYIFTPNGLERALASQYCNVNQNGNCFAPEGWSLMPMDDYFTYGLNMIPFPTNTQALTRSEASSSSIAASRSPSMEPNTMVLASQNMNIATNKPVAPPSPSQNSANPKRPHRAKQIKITKIHSEVKQNCINQGIFADEKEVLRGPDVLRIHVKTWEGLDLIQDVLNEVQETVPVARIALPFSMKNKFQKKGFITYLKVENEADVPIVKGIFGQYANAFKKCDVALPTNKDPVLEKREELMKDNFVNIIPDFGMAPLAMAKRMSAA